MDMETSGRWLWLCVFLPSLHDSDADMGVRTGGWRGGKEPWCGGVRVMIVVMVMVMVMVMVIFSHIKGGSDIMASAHALGIAGFGFSRVAGWPGLACYVRAMGMGLVSAEAGPWSAIFEQRGREGRHGMGWNGMGRDGNFGMGKRDEGKISEGRRINFGWHAE
ncbi:hypothetical protein MFRU_009g03100 [Monilinia fructicola]|uniref:Uncharacterized protein n=1 Tax=Monilinia fructicola TaxID=38448 RepID=A0A5M9K7I3_MONFR|nr:hypothetical protein EYC84_006579 [Monilinia fructicola]KAG4031545.1 hypothetical protein MFRU_009g03100 [Monilinia fructicola]